MVSTSDFASGDSRKQRKDQDLKKSFKIKFHEILSLRIISKIIANREKKKDITINDFPSKFLKFW